MNSHMQHHDENETIALLHEARDSVVPPRDGFLVAFNTAKKHHEYNTGKMLWPFNYVFDVIDTSVEVARSIADMTSTGFDFVADEVRYGTKKIASYLTKSRQL